ncbi:MAG: hypothetical protein PHW31_03985 [Candidatus Pacebacteria bacterium]|nr:hypothetical protein [Candidatus Paceibacterota bacterium]
MSKIEKILQFKIKPKERQGKLVKTVYQKKISAKELLAFFESASDIDKGNTKSRKQLLSIFEKIIKSEKNSGVKNVYVKALKAIEKEK